MIAPQGVHSKYSGKEKVAVMVYFTTILPFVNKITPIITTSDDWRYLNCSLNISGGITLFLPADIVIYIKS
jgi:hypothetical protein